MLFVVEFQRLKAAGGEGDAALGGTCSGGQRGESAGAGALKGAADCGGAGVEVEVFPAQAEEFDLAESGVEGEFEQRVQPMNPGRGEESAGFVGGEGFEAPGPRGAGADIAGDVARDLLFMGRGSYVRSPETGADQETENEVEAGASDPAYAGLGDLQRGWQVTPTDDPRPPPYVQTPGSAGARPAAWWGTSWAGVCRSAPG
ncbi:hypothetical protein FHS32_005688 [Streptomyces albaduncus]|uniref:Uncharacterized protein n=1 Tax=Streptomyces griseoloalbus TaxID=67303 RepID=A0A7W8FCW9_9ACTN|nr:hypothetical protein [Streptomyces albaduncus]